MRKGFLRNTSWAIKVAMWVGIVMMLTLIAVVVWVFVPDKQSTASLKWFQFIQTMAMFFLPPLLLACCVSERPREWLSLSHRLHGSTIGMGVAIMLIAIPGINLLSYINQQMSLPAFLEPLEQLMRQQEEAAALLTERFLKVNTIGGLLVNLGLMALLPAMAEELTFRGLLVSPFRVDGRTAVPHAWIWSSAIIFSAIHFQFYGFVPRMLLGALFGYALCWSGSLWLPMIMHGINNGVAVLLYYIAYTREMDVDSLDAIGTADTLWLGILSLVLVIPAVYGLYWVSKRYERQ